MNKVGILDYGIGNLHSVRRAFVEHCNDAKLVINADSISEISHLVIPGVGAYGTAMREIRSRNFDSLIDDFVSSGRPVLGICVGMQVLSTTGFEAGEHMGLNLIPGVVTHLGDQGVLESTRIPNMGWREIHPTNIGTTIDFFSDVHTSDSYYFAHSYEFRPEYAQHIVATADFNDRQIVAAVQSENVWGIQFHPEKSSTSGLRFIKSFLEL